ncbi:FAD-dependent oxidoreductase [Candidatus Woesearchaeota archaeon]|nr:FAD-dependent oxidoreductase [Candidatus Woesearchaeota archaeon]
MTIYDTIIIGGGSSGFSAAMYAGRLNMKTLVLCEGIGGTLAIAGSIENWPGIKAIDGYDLVENIHQHALEYGITVIEKRATSCKKKDGNFLVGVEGESYEGKTIIFATGTRVRKLGCPGEDQYANKGVHYCALCDGPLYKGKILGVVGGSDSAAKEALVLSEYASKVFIIYRGEQIRAEYVNLKRVEKKLKEDKIRIINFTNVTEIKGDEKKVTSVILDKAYNDKNELVLDGLFIEIGHIPLSDLAKDIGVALDQKGEIVIDREAKTNVEGVYAAGDVVDTKFKQAITGAGEAVLAAYSAYTYVSGKEL